MKKYRRNIKIGPQTQWRNTMKSQGDFVSKAKRRESGEKEYSFSVPSHQSMDINQIMMLSRHFGKSTYQRRKQSSGKSNVSRRSLILMCLLLLSKKAVASDRYEQNLGETATSSTNKLKGAPPIKRIDTFDTFSTTDAEFMKLIETDAIDVNEVDLQGNSLAHCSGQQNLVIS